MKDSLINKKSKRYFFTILIILFIPWIYQLSGLPDVLKLKGAITEFNQPKLTFKTWFSEDFQKKEEKFLNQKFGFRSFFVRLNNQIAYSFYNKAKANGVIIGKENYLYEKSYIKTYYGRDFIGKQKITDKVQQFKAIQDTLQKLGKNLLVVYAVGKADFYPEFIPDELKSEKKITNYEYFVRQSAMQKVNFIDFNKWFLLSKGKKEFPLYPKTGIHWSRYAMVLVADSIAKYTEKLFDKDMPDISWQGSVPESALLSLQKADRDVEEGMNLLFRLPNTLKMGYPNVIYNKKGKERITSVVISDSFYWGLFSNFFSSRFFKNGKFWFYNNAVYPDYYQEKTKTSDLDIAEQVKNTDFFIFMATDATLHKFPYGAANDLYNHFFVKDYVKKSRITKAKIEAAINYIRSDKKWFLSIQRKAKKNGISVDSMLYLDALYILKKK